MRLTKIQCDCLRAVADDGLPMVRTSTIESLLRRKLVELVNIAHPHPSNPFAVYRLTAAGREELTR